MDSGSVQIDEYCRTHGAKNEVWCYTDQEAICHQCVPTHQGHDMEHLETMIQKTRNNPRPPIQVAPVKIQPNPQPIPQFVPKPQPVPMPISSDNQYVAVEEKDLTDIKNSYLDLKSRISTMLDNEINNVNILLNETQFDPRYLDNSGKPLNYELNFPKSNYSPKPENINKNFSPKINYNNYYPVNTIPNLSPKPNYSLPDSLYTTGEFLPENRNYTPNSQFQLVIKFDKEPNLLYLYDTLMNKGRKIRINNFNLAPDSAISYCRGNILVTGGKNGLNSQSPHCYLLDLNNFVSNSKKRMNLEKRSHTLLEVGNSLVYSLGGYNSSSLYLNVVERYFIDDDFWDLTAPLPRPRQDISACIFNQAIIYTFGGAVFNEGIWIYYGNIERLDTNYEKSGWETIQLFNNNGWTARVYAGVKQISSNEILIFGGFDGQHNSETLIFNALTKSINNTNIDLRKSCSFIQRNSIMVDDEYFVFAIGFPYIDIHRFSIQEQSWKYLDASRWFNFSQI